MNFKDRFLNKLFSWRTLVLAIGVLFFIPAPSHAQQEAGVTMCGWTSKMTFNDVMMTDADGEWVLAEGDYQVYGFSKLPEIPRGDACACIKVDRDFRTHQIVQVYGGKMIPTKKCQQDPALN